MLRLTSLLIMIFIKKSLVIKLVLLDTYQYINHFMRIESLPKKHESQTIYDKWKSIINSCPKIKWFAVVTSTKDQETLMEDNTSETINLNLNLFLE